MATIINNPQSPPSPYLESPSPLHFDVTPLPKQPDVFTFSAEDHELSKIGALVKRKRKELEQIENSKESHEPIRGSFVNRMCSSGHLLLFVFHYFFPLRG